MPADREQGKCRKHPELRQHTAMDADTGKGALEREDVRRRFDRAAARFHEADFVHRHAAAGLFDRLSPIVLEVERILDAGSAAGAGSRALAERFRKSRIVSLDLSLEMLKQARASRSRFARITELQADADRLPLASGSIDLVFCNMLMPWNDEHPRFFAEVCRVLKKDGLFAFSTLGPDSFRELRDAWHDVDGDDHVNFFPDMHDIGDQLVRAGLKDPVVDVDYLTVTYRSCAALFRDLAAAGARNSLRRRRRTLTGKQRFREMEQRLERMFEGGSLPLRLELVFGHAWGSGPPATPGEYRLNVEDIGRRRR